MAKKPHENKVPRIPGRRKLKDAKGKPNIVMFMLDTQRADNIGCYGYDKPTTPHIDKLAEEGVTFLENISPAIWTMPSVTSMMTGVHAHSHGSNERTDEYQAMQPTIADILSDTGYRTTAFFGNMWAHKAHKGFREIHMPSGDANRVGPDTFNISQGRIRLAQRWIEQNYLDDHKNMPFFMYLQVMDPHSPWYPHSPYREQFKLPDVSDEEFDNANPSPFLIHLGTGRPTEREYAILRAKYDGETAGADAHVGLLADFMREKGILDETIFIVVSDHGEMFGEKKNYNYLDNNAMDHFSHHLCVYEELIKVPLVIRYPEKFFPGKKVTNYTQTHDLVPTLADIIGFDAPHSQGFSLLSALKDNPERTFTLSEYGPSTHMAARMFTRQMDRDIRIYMRALKAWREKGMKYIWTSDCCDELYDLTKDPKEEQNLIREMPKRANEMRVAMEEYMLTLPYAKIRDSVTRCDPQAMDRLRSMGWLCVE